MNTNQLSTRIYEYLCENQTGDYAYGENGHGDSLEIQWSESHKEWQLISRVNGDIVYLDYTHLHENSLADEDRDLLLDMYQRLGMDQQEMV